MKNAILDLIGEVRDWQNKWDQYGNFSKTASNLGHTVMTPGINISSNGFTGDPYYGAPNSIRVTIPPGVEEFAQMLSQNYKVERLNVGLTFGQAIEAIKEGKKAAREGWNGEGMWIAYSPGAPTLPAENFWSPANMEFARQNGGSGEVVPCITFKTADNKILMGWLASQTDMLAEDWMIIE